MNATQSERRSVPHAVRVVLPLKIAMAFSASMLLGCHDTPTSPTSLTPQRRESLSKPIIVGSFALKDLGTLSGSWSYANGLNASGDIVGSSADSNGVAYATLWPADGPGPRVLESVEGDFKGASADAINTAGDIAGVADNGTGQGATLWPAGGGAPRDLGSLPGTYSQVYGMNDAGDVVGESYSPVGGTTRATLWLSGAAPRELASLAQQSSAVAINSAGTIVGQSWFNTGGSKATLWPAGGGAPRDLGSPAGATWCNAHGINDAGDVVGHCQGDAGVPTGWILWPADGSPPRYLETSGGDAMAINNAGDIVGSIRVGADDHAAFWPADGSGMQDLGTLPGHNRAVAMGINSSRRIVGFSEAAWGGMRAVVWEPVPQQPQSITFTSSPPSGAIVGGTYIVSATGGGSGNPVTFSSLAPAVCGVSGATVTFIAGGDCTVAADQAGSAGYLAAPRVTQSFDINSRPVANAGSAQSGNEGSVITFDASASSDPDGDALINYTWDFGDGTVESVTSPTVQHVYGDNKVSGGAYVVTLSVTDAKGATSSTVNTSAAISNIAPTAVFAPTSPVDEGTFTLALTGVHDGPVDVTSLQYSFDCGDGAGYRSSGGSPSLSCPAPDNGLRSVRAEVRDKDGAANQYAGTVALVNVAPTVIITSAPASGKTGANYSIVFKFTDPGTADAPWLYQVTWGDGRRDAAPTPVNTQGLPISENYRYNKPGTYTITVRVTDKDGGSASSSVEVSIVK